MSRPHLAVMGFLSTGTGEFPLFSARRPAAKQLTQRTCSGLMHRRPHGHLDRFQIQLTGLAPILKNYVQQRTYFAFDFVPDCFRRFFSCGVRVPSTGLDRQIVSFTAIRSWLSSRKR